jgi:histidyl-tRNA synthetase
VKSLRGEEGEAQQATVPFEGVVDYIVDQIAGCGDDCDDPSHHHHTHYH